MQQHEGLRGASAAAADDVVTGDMVAQWGYCPRRLYLMYAEARWADNEHTDEGRWVHRKADAREEVLTREGDPEAPRVARSVMVESERLGARARLDLVELERPHSDAGETSSRVVPLEVKKGAVPSSGEPYPPERLQVGLQALLLRDEGFACDEALIYYAGSRVRLRVNVDDGLVADVTRALEGVRTTLASMELPPPLEDSPKCPGCSMVGICLPDETNLLRASRGGERDRDEAAVPTEDDAEPEREATCVADEDSTQGPETPRVRRLLPPLDDAAPLYVQEQGAQVGKQAERLVVSLRKETLAEVRLRDVSQLVLCGSVSVTAAALQMLCQAGVPIVHLSSGHWFYGVTHGVGLRNAFDRAAQFRRSEDAAFCLGLARAFVTAKGRNQRTLLRRNGPSGAPVLDEMRRAIERVARADSTEGLLGAEGNIAAHYFGAFATMLRPPSVTGASGASAGERDQGLRFDFNGRNRRPPRDPVNALLSFGYSLLARDATVALMGAGLDPHWGVFHRPRHGRPALALDLMEELRPLVVDSAVITAINTGAVDRGCFEVGSTGCALNATGRRAFLRCYEQRMEQELTHPVFGYRVSWRRTLAVQALLLARVFRGELAEYPAITTR